MTTEAPPQTQTSEARENPPTTRFLVACGFVALWMGLGWSFKLDANAYLLLGVPLTILFQLGVARRSLAAMWVRSSPRLRITPGWIVATLAFGAFPAIGLWQEGRNGHWIETGWMLCALAGAPAAAYALQNCDRRVIRTMPRMLAFWLFLSLLMIGSALVVKRPSLAALGSAAGVGVTSTLLYFPVSFFLEEVTFRGALDAYVYRPEDKRGMGLAMLLCCVWGLWHLPILPAGQIGFLTPIQLAAIHMLVGVPLTVAWRLGGNLLVPALVHAALDGVRNAVQSLP